MRLDEMIELPQSALNVYLQIMHATYAFGHNGTVNLSDDDLAKRTHLAKQTITNAKRLLQNQGFIHCERGKGGIKTRYRLLAYQKLDELGNELGDQLGDQLGQASRANTLTSTNIIREPPPPPPPRTPERVIIGEEIGRLSEQLGEASRAIRQLETRLAYLEETALAERRGEEIELANLPRSFDAENLPRSEDEPPELPASRELAELDALVQSWDGRTGFAPLGALGMSKLRVMLKRYGYAEMIACMDEAELANKATGRYGGVSFVFFEAVMERRHRPKKPRKPKPTQKKGASQNGGHEDSDYRMPERTGNEPWKRREQACSA